MPEHKKSFQLKDAENPRDAALVILLRVCEERQKSHYVLREVLADCPTMQPRDKAFAKRAAEGSLDYLIRLDYLLSRYLKKPFRLQKPLLRNLLRLSLYQILYMDKVPDSAVCNEAVKLAKLHGFSGLSGVVNGVLRAVIRDKEAGADRLLSVPDRAADLAVPKWLYQKLQDSFGTEQAETIASAWLLERPAVLRLNRSRAAEAEAEALLMEDGVCFRRLESEAFFRSLGLMSCSAAGQNERKRQGAEAQHTGMQNAGLSGAGQRGEVQQETALPLDSGPALPVFYEVSGIAGLSELRAFREGILQPQDMSAAIPAVLAAPKAGDYVIDVCAAPGGKSLQLADMLYELENGQQAGIVDARDLSPQKVRLIEENIARSGFRNIRARVQDALETDEDSLFRADIVIADLPCSGLGIAARKPDIKQNVEPYSITELRELQRDMLRVISRYVKPRGKLVYSTCTLTREENEENAAFIAEELGFQLEREIRVFPDQEHDGFYAALLTKQYT